MWLSHWNSGSKNINSCNNPFPGIMNVETGSNVTSRWVVRCEARPQNTVPHNITVQLKRTPNQWFESDQGLDLSRTFSALKWLINISLLVFPKHTLLRIIVSIFSHLKHMMDGIYIRCVFPGEMHSGIHSDPEEDKELTDDDGKNLSN